MNTAHAVNDWYLIFAEFEQKLIDLKCRNQLRLFAMMIKFLSSSTAFGERELSWKCFLLGSYLPYDGWKQQNTSAKLKEFAGNLYCYSTTCIDLILTWVIIFFFFTARTFFLNLVMVYLFFWFCLLVSFYYSIFGFYGSIHF